MVFSGQLKTCIDIPEMYLSVSKHRKISLTVFGVFQYSVFSKAENPEVDFKLVWLSDL